jgi:hypothetical protein
LLDGVFAFPWASGITSFLEQNVQGLIILFLISLYSEFVRFDELKEYLRNRCLKLDEIKDALPPISLVEHALSKEYIEVPDTLALATTIISDKVIFIDTTVRIDLYGVEGSPDLYKRDYTLSFSAVLDYFTFAIAETSLVSEALIATIPELTEVIVLNRDENIKNVDIDNIVKVSVQVSDKKGSKTDVQLNFKTLKNNYASDTQDIKDGVNYLLYNADVPEQSGTLRNFIVKISRELPVNKAYTYWASDRPLFLKSFSINTRHFPENKKWNFEPVPFLSNLPSGPLVNKKNGVLDIPFNNWIVRGQGVCLIWSLKK